MQDLNQMRILFSTYSIHININSHMDEINRNVIKPLKCFQLVKVLAAEVYYSGETHKNMLMMVCQRRLVSFPHN